jgi:hypothetical protein
MIGFLGFALDFLSRFPFLFPLTVQWPFNFRSQKNAKTGCRPFLLIQVDLMVDRKTLPVHLITHEKKIKSKPYVHCQNLHSAIEALEKRSLPFNPCVSLKF